MIIGLGYKAHTGKDTVGEYLYDCHGFKRTAFAEELKKAAMVTFGLTYEQVYNPELKNQINPRWGITNRQILQRFGEQMCDLWGPTFWTDKVRDRIISEGDMPRLPDTKWVEGKKPGSWVITDVRKFTEVNAVKSWGGLVVLVDGPSRGIVGEEASKHKTEQELDGWDGWDGVISNQDDIVSLYTNIEGFLTQVRGEGNGEEQRSGVEHGGIAQPDG